MKEEIICWNTRDRINIINNKGIFEQVLDDKDKIFFYKLKGDIFKIVETDKSLEDVCSYCNENYNSNSIIIIDKINKENFNLIKTIISKSNFVVITGEIDLEDCNRNNLIKRIVLLPQLSHSKKNIDIKSLILFLENLINENRAKNYLDGSRIILGYKEDNEPLGNIPLTILRNFKYLADLKELELCIYSSTEQSMQDLCYIKDPILEYLPHDAMLKINQIIDDGIDGKIFFSLIVK